MLSGFKQFILRGNVVDMAVGVVIGAAFASVVGAFTKDLLTPLIAALFGKPLEFVCRLPFGCIGGGNVTELDDDRCLRAGRPREQQSHCYDVREAISHDLVSRV